MLELRSLIKVFGYYAILGITNKASHYQLVFGREILPKCDFSSFFHFFRAVTPSMFFVDFLKKFIKKAALLGCWIGLMRFRVHALASHQIAVGFAKKHLLSYLPCSQMWLNPPVDGCHCDYTTKVKKTHPHY